MKTLMIKKVRSHHSFMVNYSLLLLKAFMRPAMVFAFFLSFTMFIASVLGIYYFEHATNLKITNLFDATYYTVTVFTGVGLGDIFPITTGGRIVSMFIMLSGTAIYVSLTAVIATTILSLEMSYVLKEEED
ncbi:MAG: two pore domain potassium channel family protein [Bdellovibrionaceae bacterium]|nr:two pore domain potassium channel family protein [Pseudobdellovibrionaceae bacterium]